MSDFLSRLTARSFGAESAIRPRVGSLFEPVRSRAALGELPDAGLTETDGVWEPDETWGREPRVARRVTPLWRGEEEAGDVAQTKDKHSGLKMVSPPRPIAEKRIRAEEADGEDEGVEKMSAPHRSLRAREESVLELKPPGRVDATTKLATLFAHAPSPAKPRKALSPQEPRGITLPEKVATEMTAQMNSGAAAGPEPTVQVTIGRIEVRANSESKPVVASRRASPVMSLEEYLQRRTQRGGQ